MVLFATVLFLMLVCESLTSVKSNPPSNEIKVGQCPYTLKTPSSCNFECKSDSSCHSTEKCCSNGCGTQCMQPLNFTMCQHQRAVAQYHVQQGSTKSNYVPVCKDDGTYESKQCDLTKNECWCVDFRGFEISQTRTSALNSLECSEDHFSKNCPLYRCKKDCDHGFKLDSNGCRTCECINPCSSIECCKEKSCQLLNVQCKAWPCPPLPLCLTSPNNPCVSGEPLKIDNVNVVCDAEKRCPFSYMCRSNVFSTNGSCCRQIGNCLPLNCNLSCRYGYAYDSYECPICECHEPCKAVLCPPPTTCKVVQVQCIRAPCLPIASCE